MDREELLNLSKEFMQEAFQANCYYDISRQYSVNFKEYHEEMKFSSAFYAYTYNALVIATFMELAKIYDTHKNSINIFEMINICKDHIYLFPQQRDEFKMIVDNKEIIKKIPYEHSVSPEEKDFFQNEVESQEPINKVFNITEIRVEMTLERYFDLYKWKYERIEPQVKNLLKQRNKVYAHNDRDSLGNIEEVISKFPLYRKNIESLISFSLEFCQFVISLLTGINEPDQPANINDWEETLHLARLGYKYQNNAQLNFL